MTYEKEIINGYIDDISNLYREFFDEVKKILRGMEQKVFLF